MKLVQTQAVMALASRHPLSAPCRLSRKRRNASGAPPAEAAAPAPEPPKVNIASAVTCQVLISQFDDSVAAAKVEDAVKASARALRGDGNKACNAWNYEAGIGSVRVAIETIGRKPVR